MEDGFLVFRQLIVLDDVNDELMMIMIKSKVTLFFESTVTVGSIL